MKNIFLNLCSFLVGCIFSAFVAYNIVYVSLKHSQLHSSQLFYERLNNNSISEIKESLKKVMLPNELCEAYFVSLNFWYIEQNSMQEAIEKGFDMLKIKKTKQDAFCSKRLDNIS